MMMRVLRRSALIAAVLLLAMAGPVGGSHLARAAVSIQFAVTSCSGDPAVAGSLPYEVNQADNNINGAGGTVGFALSCAGASAVTLTSPLDITAPVDVEALGATAVIDGGHSTFLFNVSSALTLRGLTLQNGRSASGGGAIDSSGSLTINSSVFTNNDATGGNGGAIRSTGALTVTNSTFTGNIASAHGGAVDANGSLTSTLTGDTFSGNSASDGGALSFGTGNSATITNSTITGNTATDTASGATGGSALYDYSTVTLSFDTIADNTGTGYAVAGDATYGGGYLIARTILDNTANCGTGTGATFASSFSDGGSNLTYQGGSCGLTGITNVDPQLRALASNGGPTQTMALAFASPAIDAAVSCSANGVGVTTDQRGIARPQGSACDIGAYEFRTPSFAPSIDKKYTNEGTSNSALVLTGVTEPGATVNLYAGSCSASGATAPMGSAVAGADGKWSYNLGTAVAEGPYTYSLSATDSSGSTSACTATSTLTVDHTAPSSQITFPGVNTAANAATWNSGCSSSAYPPQTVGICGTAQDTGSVASGVAAVYVAIESTSGTTGSRYWNGSAWVSTPTWVRANGTTSWSYPMTLPADGTYVVLSGAIDNAGNAEAVLAGTITGCAPSTSGVTFVTSTGGGPTFSTGGGPTFSTGGGCGSSSGGGPTFSTGGSVTFSTGGGPTFSTGGGSGSGCTNSSVSYDPSSGGGPTFSTGGGPTFSTGVGGACNMTSVIVDTRPPAVTTDGFEVNGYTADGSMNVDPAAPLHIAFDGGLDSTTINSTNIRLTTSTGAAAGDAPTCGTDPTCANVVITGLLPAHAYTVTVNGVADWAGNVMTTPQTFHFTTAASSPLTGPAAADSDGDGIPDGWDGGSVTVNGNTINTGAWGFSPTHKDVCLVENYMDTNQSGGQTAAADGFAGSQAISHAANQAIVDAFSAQGIRLVIFEGDATDSAGLPSGYTGPYYGGPIPMVDPLGTMDSSSGFSWDTAYPGTTKSFEDIRSQYFVPTGLQQFCHYAVIAHNIGNTRVSGSSRGISTSDMVIALGTTTSRVGDQAEQEGTVMHELGHNLGLHHGGSDEINYKPNYPSVMNYLFQFTGIPLSNGSSVLDYSHGTMASLDENSLNDSTGLGSNATGFSTWYSCPSGGENFVVNAANPISWDCSGNTTSTVKADINGDQQISTLNDNNDWQSLVFDGGVIGLGRTRTILFRPRASSTRQRTRAVQTSRALAPGAWSSNRRSLSTGPAFSLRWPRIVAAPPSTSGMPARPTP